MRLENIIKFYTLHERVSYRDKSIGLETPSSPSPPISFPRRRWFTEGLDSRLLDLAQGLQYPKRSKSPTAVES